jgi:hypothetical protein
VRCGWLVLLVGALACDRPKTPPRAEAPQPSTAPAPSAAEPRAGPAGAAKVADAALTTGSTMTFDGDTVGAPPTALEPVVGDWSIAEAPGSVGLKVDGARWRDGTPSANLADQAKRLYGDRYAAFLDGVKTFAFYPLAVVKEPPPAGDLRVSVRFYPVAGKIDQAAGIAFGIAPDGSYLAVRANALEDNILFFKVVRGKRTVFDTVRAVPTPTRTWHTLVAEIREKKLTVSLDGTKRFEKALESPPVGRVGLWSKADSQVLFDDLAVEKL